MYKSVDKYLSPNEGMITTIVFPLFSGRMLTSIAAFTAAPNVRYYSIMYDLYIHMAIFFVLQLYQYIGIRGYKVQPKPDYTVELHVTRLATFLFIRIKFM